jgi:hypothetical protein
MNGMKTWWGVTDGVFGWFTISENKLQPPPYIHTFHVGLTFQQKHNNNNGNNNIWIPILTLGPTVCNPRSIHHLLFFMERFVLSKTCGFQARKHGSTPSHHTQQTQPTSCTVPHQ